MRMRERAFTSLMTLSFKFPRVRPIDPVHSCSPSSLPTWANPKTVGVAHYTDSLGLSLLGEMDGGSIYVMGLSRDNKCICFVVDLCLHPPVTSRWAHVSTLRALPAFQKVWYEGWCGLNPCLNIYISLWSVWLSPSSASCSRNVHPVWQQMMVQILEPYHLHRGGGSGSRLNFWILALTWPNPGYSGLWGVN